MITKPTVAYSPISSRWAIWISNLGVFWNPMIDDCTINKESGSLSCLYFDICSLDYEAKTSLNVYTKKHEDLLHWFHWAVDGKMGNPHPFPWAIWISNVRAEMKDRSMVLRIWSLALWTSVRRSNGRPSPPSQFTIPNKLTYTSQD